MKVYNHETNERVTDYIGCWYPQQTKAQPIHLYLSNDGDVTIEHDPNIGGGVSSDVWHRRALSFTLNGSIYTEEEAGAMIEEYAELCDKLVDSYEERWNGNNYVGYWDEELEQILMDKIQRDSTESVLFFDSEGMMDEESEVEE